MAVDTAHWPLSFRPLRFHLHRVQRVQSYTLYPHAQIHAFTLRQDTEQFCLKDFEGDPSQPPLFLPQGPFLNPGQSVLTSVTPSFQECYVNSQCNLLRLFPPTQHNSSKIHPNCCIYQQFPPFHCWGVFRAVFHLTQTRDCSFLSFRGGVGCTAQLSRS